MATSTQLGSLAAIYTGEACSMAKVPMNFNTGASGQSPLMGGAKPSDANLLMAAADMHASGAFKPKSPMPNERPRLTGNKPRKLKLVK